MNLVLIVGFNLFHISLRPRTSYIQPSRGKGPVESLFTYRGVDLDQLLDMTYEQLMGLVNDRACSNSQEVGIKLCVAETSIRLLPDMLSDHYQH